jgi:2,4-dienoyl-CoA reductase-like NADH-dependent reductase (Old Yellow Enzyme family)/thioredoxin reductase
MSEYPLLFSPGKIGSMELKNRVVMAPMVRNYADEQGRITDRYRGHMGRIARGGVGMMILDATFVGPEGRGFPRQIGIHSDDMIPGFRALVDELHRWDVKVGPQLHHAGRMTSVRITGARPVAPSPIRDPAVNEEPRALTVAEIRVLVEAYADGARRAREAGCDFVEIHGAHGYLIAQFLSPYSNHRDDAYGGTPEGRRRFLEEVVGAMRREVGGDFPVTVRLSCDELVAHGLTPHNTAEIARRLQELGVDAIHVSAGNPASYTRGYTIPPMAVPDGVLLPYARGIKRAVDIPVIAVGKIRDPKLAEGALRDGAADFVALGRPLLADPDWPMKAVGGRSDEINLCIACNQGCIGRLFDRLDVWCTVNPETGRELEFARPAPESAKCVLVAGGGPAGMEAAKIAAERGHRVILCEMEDRLGGQLAAAAAAPHRHGWAELRDYLEGEMRRLKVDVRLNTRATPDLARRERADVAIIAVGASPLRQSIPGIDRPHVVTSRDLLEGKATAKGAVVVAGGGCAGAQTAEYLAARGHSVTIVEMLSAIAEDAPLAERELLLARLQQLGVVSLTETKIVDIGRDRVTVQYPGGLRDLHAETVVICMGSRSNDGIADEMAGVVGASISVGDAVSPRKTTEAMLEGARAALSC